MQGTESPGYDAHDDVREAVQLTREGDFNSAIEIFERHLSQLSGGSLSDKRIAAAACSYYGVCLAMVRRRYAEAVKYCNISLQANFMDPVHRYNLALVYLERNDRRKAVETLNAGLRLEPDNTQINRIFEKIGRRGRPTLGFLSRDNPVNVWLGRLRHRGRKA